MTKSLGLSLGLMCLSPGLSPGPIMSLGLMGMSLGLSPGLIQSYILYIAKEEGKAGPILSTEGQKPEQEVTQKDSPDESEDNRLRSPEEIMEKYKNDPFAFKRGSFKLSLEKIEDIRHSWGVEGLTRPLAFTHL